MALAWTLKFGIPTPGYKPLYGVLFDMIGDADLQIFQEGYSVESAPEVVTRVWSTAADLGYAKYFISQAQGTITDDHVPLQKVGIHVIDVIDIQYGVLPKNYGPTDTAKRPVSSAARNRAAAGTSGLSTPISSICRCR